MKNLYNPCIVCNSVDRQLLSKVGRNFTKLTTVICAGCGLIHSHPIPSKNELDKYYRDNYRKKYKLVDKPQLRHTVRYSKGCLDIVKEILNYGKFKNLKNKSFLDVGSGSGEVLYYAQKIGFKTLGIEPNTGYANFCQEDLKLNVLNTTLENADLKKKKFDVINLNQVLEHLPYPIDTLKYLKKILNYEGILLLTVPDIMAQLHSPYTRFHYAHIYNYNHLNLKKLFDNVGLQILNPETRSTKIFAKKIIGPDNSKIHFDLKKNYMDVSKSLHTDNHISHFATLTPYKRFIKKCFIYPKEIIIGAYFRKHKEVLDWEFQKFKFNPIASKGHQMSTNSQVSFYLLSYP